MKLLGELTVTVEYGTQKCELPLVIVRGNKPALFERNWLEKIKLDWGEIFAVSKSSPVDRLVSKYYMLFDVRRPWEDQQLQGHNCLAARNKTSLQED